MYLPQHTLAAVFVYSWRWFLSHSWVQVYDVYLCNVPTTTYLGSSSSVCLWLMMMCVTHLSSVIRRLPMQRTYLPTSRNQNLHSWMRQKHWMLASSYLFSQEMSAARLWDGEGPLFRIYTSDELFYLSSVTRCWNKSSPADQSAHTILWTRVRRTAFSLYVATANIYYWIVQITKINKKEA